MEREQTSHPAHSVPGQRRILLHVLSPSSEVPNKLTFTEFPTSATVAELKKAIQDAVATRPAPERQRLIYRGRALLQDNISISDIIGQEAVCNPIKVNLKWY